MTKNLTTGFARSLGSILLLLFLTIGMGRLAAQCPFTPSFTHPSSYICVGSSLTFTNTTTGTYTGRAWWDNITNFSTLLSPTRTFNTPGLSVISLIETNGICTDTVQSAVMVSPTMTATLVPTNPVCFGGTNGSINLTPGGGTPNRSISNNRAISDYTNANSVCNAGFTGGITLEAWVKPRATWTTGDGLFMAFNQSGGTGNRFFLGYNPDAGFNKFVYFDDNLGNQFLTVTSPVNAWYHVAVTITSANVVSLYLNGNLNRTFSTNAGWIPQPGDRFNMGQEWDFALTSQHFDGFIDEARVWNAVLSPATILSNRNSCMGINNTHPNWGNLVAYYSMNEGSGGYVFDRSGRNNHGSRVNGTAYGTAVESNWGCFSDGSGYGYTWSTGATTQDISGIGAGTYTVTLMDGAGAGCNLVQNTSLTNPAQVVVALSPVGPVPICAGASTPLSASGANTYAWSPALGLSGTTGANVTATPAATQTYTCVGTNAVGCTGSSTVQVVVNPLPTATITGTNVICAGQSTTLNAGGGVSYAWSNGPIVAGNTVTPAATTTYTVTATNSFNCTDTEVMTVTVNPLPTATITGTNVICNGQSTTLTAGGGASYVWSNGPIVAPNTVAPAATTTYTVTATNSFNCTDTEVMTVTVNPTPTATITGTNVICDGQSTTLTAGGGVSYVWSNGPTVAPNTVSPTATTTYTVTATNSFNCTDTELMTVTVNPLPIVAITGDTTLCLGDTTTLTASGGTGYVWSNGPTTAANTITPAATTTYSVTVTDANTCSRSKPVTVTVNPLPVVSFAGQDTICLGDTTTITASGGTSYIWNTGAVTAAVVLSPPTTTNYVVTVTDANTCSKSGGIAIVVNALPILNFVGQDTICDGDTTQVTVGGALSYLWSHGPTSPLVDLSPTVTSTFGVIGTDINGCATTDSFQIWVNGLPPISISGNDTICLGDSTALLGAGGNTYLWSTGDITALINTMPTANATYVLTGTDLNGCSNTAALMVVVNPLPAVSIAGLDSICIGDSTMLTASGGLSYFWDIFSANQSITVAPVTNTTYTVTATDANGCQASASQAVTVNALPATPVITQTGNTMSTTTGLAGYQWYLNGNAIVGATSSSYTATLSGSYTVMVTNGSGCDATSAAYSFIFVAISQVGLTSFGLEVYPNPNGGHFTVRLDLERDRNVDVAIYDLMGKQVWSHSGDLPYGEWKREVDLTVFARGTYLLQVVSEGQKVTRKVVVQ
jgi:Concanavalin A-like lectin/glucanases superfamily/Secretion system C-terminal sorting domain